MRARAWLARNPRAASVRSVEPHGFGAQRRFQRDSGSTSIGVAGGGCMSGGRGNPDNEAAPTMMPSRCGRPYTCRLALQTSEAAIPHPLVGTLAVLDRELDRSALKSGV